MNLPTMQSYGDYSSDNYGAHSLCVELGGLSIYFSYHTPVAYRGSEGLVISENCWSTTTGKHLNWICPDKSRRIPNDEFNLRFHAELEKHGLQ